MLQTKNEEAGLCGALKSRKVAPKFVKEAWNAALRELEAAGYEPERGRWILDGKLGAHIAHAVEVRSSRVFGLERVVKHLTIAWRSEFAAMAKTYKAHHSLADAVTIEMARAAVATARRTGDLSKVYEYGETLTRRYVVGSTFASLLEEWPKHGYRPTIRVDMGEEQLALAELYDFAQLRAGRQVVCYRGGGRAWAPTSYGTAEIT